MTVLCATGHRPNKLGGYQSQWFEKTRFLAWKWLQIEGNRPDELVGGLAQGFDQGWMAAGIELGIPVTAAIPFTGQEKKWPPHAQQLYNWILGRCDKSVVVSEGGYEPWKMFKRNEWMVDNSDGCAALWNGDHSGGTYDTVKYVERRQQARPDYTFINLWPEWEKLK